MVLPLGGGAEPPVGEGKELKMGAIIPGSRLLFSIATNGYDRHFAGLLGGQRAFAERCGAEFWVARESPPWGISAHDSAWLKIAILAEALARGFEWVLYLDADCEVRACPSPVDTLAADPAAVFVCHDFSHRINAAVIFVRNGPEARRLFRRLRWSAFRPTATLPPADRNLYENGHVIHYLKGEPAVRILDNRWNCSIYGEVADPFIFHHGGTPIREARKPAAIPRWAQWRARLADATTGFRLALHQAHYARTLPAPRPGRGANVT